MIHRIEIDKGHHHLPLLHQKWPFPQLLDKTTSASVDYPPHWGAGNWSGLRDIQIPAKSNLFCIVSDPVKIWTFEICIIPEYLFFSFFSMGEQGKIKSRAWHELPRFEPHCLRTRQFTRDIVLVLLIFGGLTPNPTAIRPLLFNSQIFSNKHTRYNIQ